MKRLRNLHKRETEDSVKLAREKRGRRTVCVCLSACVCVCVEVSE